MDKFRIDYDALIQKAATDSNKIPLSGNEHRLVRVAFDLFRLKDGDPEELWQVQSSDDGEFLVRTFSIPDDEKVAESSNWSIEMDKKEANLTISYKQIPLTRIAAKDYNANTPEDAFLLKRVIYKKLMTEPEFGKKLVASLPVEKQNALQGIMGDIEVSQGPVIDEWKLAALELKLQKDAMCGKDHAAEDDAGFDEAWWDSGMETYGPGAAGEWGAEADEAEEVREKVDKFLNDVANDPYLSKKITIGDLESVIEDLEKFNSGEIHHEDMEKTLEKAKSKVEGLSADDDENTLLELLEAEDELNYGNLDEEALKLLDLGDEGEAEDELNYGNLDEEALKLLDLDDEESEEELEADDDEPSTYQEYFMQKAKEFDIDPTSLPSVPDKKLKKFFEAVDRGWVAKNESGMAQASLKLSKRAEEDVPLAPTEWLQEEEPEMPFETEGIGAKNVEEILKDIQQLKPEELNELAQALAKLQ